ncbi:hypothetical protein QL285_056034 [Trifolium repens]|nr:hypothetical protein QL285_056034 [Trifolium repens]
MRFNRVMEAFDVGVALAHGKYHNESGRSEYPPESSTNFSDLVLSFMEDDERSREKEGVVRHGDRNRKSGREEVEKIGEWCDNEKSEMLKKLFGGNENVDENERDAKEIIRKEAKVEIGELVGSDLEAVCYRLF